MRSGASESFTLDNSRKEAKESGDTPASQVPSFASGGGATPAWARNTDSLPGKPGPQPEKNVESPFEVDEHAATAGFGEFKEEEEPEPHDKKSDTMKKLGPSPQPLQEE